MKKVQRELQEVQAEEVKKKVLMARARELEEQQQWKM